MSRTTRESEHIAPDVLRMDCETLLEFVGQPGLSQDQRFLLLQDYAGRARGLSRRRRSALDLRIIEAISGVSRRGQPDNVSSEGEIDVADIGILTIIPPELDATLDAFNIDRKQFVLPGKRRFFNGSVASALLNRELSIVITNVGRSKSIQVAPTFYEMMRIFDPQVVFLVGIAAGDPEKFGFGDVAIASSVRYYEPGRDTESGIQMRHEIRDVPEGLFLNLSHYRPGESNYYTYFRAMVERTPKAVRPKGVTLRTRPKVIADNVQVATGEKVIDREGFFPEARLEWDERVTVADMESYGLAECAWKERRDWAVFRGISDFGANKTDEWHRLAAGSAALALRDFLEDQYIPRDEHEL